MKKKIIFFITLFFCAIAAVVVVFSYAYFSSNIIYDNSFINLTLPGGLYSLTTTNASDISYNFEANMMMESKASNIAIANGNVNLDVSLLSPDNETRTVCSYDLVWEWTSSDKYTESDTYLPYIIYDNGLKIYNYEMSVEAIGTTVGNDEDFTNRIVETDLSSLAWKNGKAPFVTNAIIISENNVVQTVTSWNIKSRIYNIPVPQPNLQGKEFKAKINVENINCNLLTGDNVAQIVSGDLNTIGSEVTINNEHFYVIGDEETNSSNVKLLAKYNLKVGNQVELNYSTEDISYVGVYDSNTPGYGYQSNETVPYTIQDKDGNDILKVNGGVAFAEHRYWMNNGRVMQGYKEYYAPSDTQYYVYNYNSNLFNYIQSYGRNVSSFGVSVLEARPIRYEELMNIMNHGFIPEITFAWTGSVATGKEEGDIYLVTAVDGGGIETAEEVDADIAYGVRPVIIVPKSAFN